MKRASVGVALGVLMVIPGSAGAVVVPGATYTGEVTSPTAVGTVSFEVSADATELDFTASNFGTAPCDGNSFGPIEDIPITDETVAYSANDITINADFSGSPGSAFGSIRSQAFCESGNQFWVADTPVAWADMYISRDVKDSDVVGQNIYNSTAAGQVRKWTAKQGQARRFHVVLDNKGNETGSFGIRGCRSSSKFKIGYSWGGENHTDAVTEGTYNTPDLAPGGFDELRLKITPTGQAKPGAKKVCKVKTTGGDQAEAVKAQLTVKPG